MTCTLANAERAQGCTLKGSSPGVMDLSAKRLKLRRCSMITMILLIRSSFTGKAPFAHRGRCMKSSISSDSKTDPHSSDR